MSPIVGGSTGTCFSGVPHPTRSACGCVGVVADSKISCDSAWPMKAGPYSPQSFVRPLDTSWTMRAVRTGCPCRRGPVVGVGREAGVDVARQQDHRLVARERGQQGLVGAGLVGPRLRVDLRQQAREALQRDQRQLHALGAQRGHGQDDQRDLGVGGRPWRQRRGHRRIAEQPEALFAGQPRGMHVVRQQRVAALVVDAAGLRHAMREPPLRASVHDQHAMTRAFHLVGELDQRPERRRRLRRTARRRRRARQSEQLVQRVRRRAPRGRRQRHERADRLQRGSPPAPATSGAGRCPTPASRCRR